MTALCVSVALFVGCGTAATNNQGISFTLLGFFAELPESGSDTLPTGELGQATPLSSENPELQTGNVSGAVSTVAGMKNNIISQFIRVDRMVINYYIEGANVQPPSTTVGISALLGPSVSSTSSSDSTSTDSSSSGTSKPPSSLPNFSTISELSFGSFPIVPPEVTAWLNLNRAQLPEAPFTMLATVKASAVSSSGQRYYSNPADYFIIFTPDNVIAPTEGSIVGSDTTTDTTTTTG